MKKIIMALCTAMLAASGATGQQKIPTLDELIPGGANYKFAENLYGTHWWGDVCIKPDVDSLFTVDPQTGKETLLFTRQTVNNELGNQEGAGILHYLYNVKFPWKDRKEALLEVWSTSESVTNVKFFAYDFEKNKLRNLLTISPLVTSSDYSAEGNHVAYTRKNNLYVDNDQVTDEPEGVECGQSVHRNEFGISKGTFWSPKGNLLAFYRMDERMVTGYPFVDITTRIAEARYERYPMAGMASHKVTVGVYNPATKETVYLDAGDPTDRYFTNISWSPDESSIYLIELNRDQNHAKLCRYDVKTGKLMATLFEETHPKYVEPMTPIVFLPWDSGKFIYQSQKDGFNHLYLYNTEGKLIKQLTSGNWLVRDLVGFDEKSKEVVITSTEDSPLQSNIFRVSVPSGKRTRIGTATGVHYAQLSASGKYAIDTYSSPESPRTIAIVDTHKDKTIDLLNAKDPLEGYRIPDIETGTIKAADGTTDLYYRLVKPLDFDATKKYPAVVYVYGGPHAQNITNTWRNAVRGWDIYMATKGYVVFTLDNRGSSNRGLEFENCTFRHLGIEECKDQVKGAEFLKSLPYVDGNRIGVHGWSFGGHMTTALMLRYPEIFKVGVAGGPVIDWSYYEVMYGERYMDTPETNPDGYRECNLKNMAGNLKGHLLIIHDDQDDTCVPQHTLSFMHACIEAGTYPDLFIYPGHKHNVSGRDRVHLHEKITRYFEDYLK